MSRNKEIGRFVLRKDEFIGKGSFAMVYKGHFKSDPTRTVAVKIINRLGLDDTMENHLKQEINSMRNLDSPYICKLYDVQRTPKKYYLFIEYCAGGDLGKLLKNMGRKNEKLTLEQSKGLILQIAKGMKAVSKLKLMHRDLKPANILLSSKDPSTMVAKIADFGFAKMLNRTSQLNKTMCGSPIYMAPELLYQNNYTRSVDLWSMGVIFYELVVGHPPYVTGNYMKLLDMVRKDEVVYPKDMDAGIRDLLKRLLVKDPKKRITFEEFFRHPLIGLRSKEELEAEAMKYLRERIQDVLSFDEFALPIQILGDPGHPKKTLTGLTILMECEGGHQDLSLSETSENEEVEGEEDDEEEKKVTSVDMEEVISTHGYFTRNVFPFDQPLDHSMKEEKKTERNEVEFIASLCNTKCRQIFSLIESCFVRESCDEDSTISQTIAIQVFTLHIIYRTIRYVEGRKNYLKELFSSSIRRKKRDMIYKTYHLLRKKYLPWLRGMAKGVGSSLGWQTQQGREYMGGPEGLNKVEVKYVEQLIYEYVLVISRDALLKTSVVYSKMKERNTAIFERSVCLLELLLEDLNRLLKDQNEDKSYIRSLLTTFKKIIQIHEKS